MMNANSFQHIPYTNSEESNLLTVPKVTSLQLVGRAQTLL